MDQMSRDTRTNCPAKLVSKEGEGEIDRERQREKERDRERQREIERQKESEIVTERERQRDREGAESIQVGSALLINFAVINYRATGKFKLFDH